MEITDLRIGNLVKYEMKQAFVVVIDAPQQKLIIKYIDESLPISVTTYSGLIVGRIAPIIDISGIEVTEDFLLKNGMKKTVIGGILAQYSDKYYDGHEFKDGIFHYHTGDCYWLECKCVHQLQNLYFALTGEEFIPPRPQS